VTDGTSVDAIANESAAVLDLTSRYEGLRQAGLGGTLTPVERAGLSIFLRRGMWAWVCVVTEPPACAPASSRRPPRSRVTGAPGLDPTVQILASMAMHITQGAA
jgi:hypothetical protein